MDNAIITLVNNTLPGKIKPRLAESIGDVKALEVYVDLLKHTSTELLRVQANRYVYFSDEIPEKNEIFPESGFIYELQSGKSKVEILKRAFESVCSLGYSKVIFVQGDCPEITFDIIISAFNNLNDHDVVIGATRRGDFYAFGLKEMITNYFDEENKDSKNISDQMIDNFINENKIWYELPILSDIETEEDLQLNRVKQFYRRIVDQASIVQ